MKRFFSFLLFVLLLVVAVASLQTWKERSSGGGFSARRALLNLFQPGESGQRRPEKYTVADGPRIDLKDVNVLDAMSRQRILLARAVVPSVVSITTQKAIQTPDGNEDQFFQFFHRGMRRGTVPAQKSLGSGAIVSKEGHIVTNNHVIDQMDQIEVKLSDGRLRTARLIGTDPDTDIAILKIDADNLQPLPFGDSELVEVGETVMAVGNPYGLDESVTQGIISAKGRRGSENVSDLFQTDAAINPGNSGGPLVNVRGELIGINEAIFSQSGGWQGVGFAIPSATVRGTMDTILKTGRVIHGYLGILQQPINEDVLRQGGMGNERGVLVDRVVDGSPAEKADIQPGDLIQKFNNKAVTDFQDLRHGVASVPVDTTVPIELLRKGKRINVNAQIAERPPPSTQLSRQNPRFGLPPQPDDPRPRANPGRAGRAADADTYEGVQVAEISPALLQKMDLPADLRGVIVRRIEPGTAGAEKLQLGDVIEQVNQQPVANVADFTKTLRVLPPGHPVVLSVMRERNRMLVVLNGD